jgi:hypothetical protein
MTGEDSRETAHPKVATDEEHIRLSYQPSAGATKHQPEYTGFMVAGFVLLVALVVFVHLLVIYRS